MTSQHRASSGETKGIGPRESRAGHQGVGMRGSIGGVAIGGAVAPPTTDRLTQNACRSFPLIRGGLEDQAIWGMNDSVRTIDQLT